MKMSPARYPASASPPRRSLECWFFVFSCLEKIFYSSEGAEDPGVLEIVELDGTRTMVHLMEPIPLSIRLARSHSLARP